MQIFRKIIIEGGGEWRRNNAWKFPASYLLADRTNFEGQAIDESEVIHTSTDNV